MKFYNIFLFKFFFNLTCTSTYYELLFAADVKIISRNYLKLADTNFKLYYIEFSVLTLAFGVVELSKQNPCPSGNEPGTS